MADALSNGNGDKPSGTTADRAVVSMAEFIESTFAGGRRNLNRAFDFVHLRLYAIRQAVDPEVERKVSAARAAIERGEAPGGELDNAAFKRLLKKEKAKLKL